MSGLDDALAEAEQLERIEREFAEHAAKVNAEWPSAGRTTARPVAAGVATGLAGLTHTAPTEYIFDLCDALPPEVCHRCGQVGIDPDDRGTGECRFCGWYLNDGLMVT
jgi:hypothetical protein